MIYKFNHGPRNYKTDFIQWFQIYTVNTNDYILMSKNNFNDFNWLYWLQVWLFHHDTAQRKYPTFSNSYLITSNFNFPSRFFPQIKCTTRILWEAWNNGNNWKIWYAPKQTTWFKSTKRLGSSRKCDLIHVVFWFDSRRFLIWFKCTSIKSQTDLNQVGKRLESSQNNG